MRTLPERFSELVGPGDNVLLLCPAFARAGSTACVDLLTIEPPAQVNALSITYTQSPCDRLALCDQYVDGHPADTVIINIDANTRSSATSITGDDSTEHHAELTIDSVSSSTDVTGLGVTITNRLDEWTADTPDRQIVACFHSVTALLQYIDLQQAFKFLDVVTRRFTAANAIAHYHMDPAAHDNQTIRRVIPLFDVVYEYENREWILRTS